MTCLTVDNDNDVDGNVPLGVTPTSTNTDLVPSQTKLCMIPGREHARLHELTIKAPSTMCLPLRYHFTNLDSISSLPTEVRGVIYFKLVTYV
jgi:hypothetical protein